MKAFEYEIPRADEWGQVIQNVIATGYRGGWGGLWDEFLHIAFGVYRPTKLVPMTISFYVRSAEPGMYCHSLSNARLEVGPPLYKSLPAGRDELVLGERHEPGYAMTGEWAPWLRGDRFDG